MAGAMPNWDILRSTGISKQITGTDIRVEAAKQTRTSPTACDNEPNQTFTASFDAWQANGLFSGRRPPL